MSSAPRSRRRPSPAALAVSAAGVATLCAAATLLLSPRFEAGFDVVVASDLVLATVWPWVGALIVRARPRNPVGWLMLVPALMGPYLLAGMYAAHTGGDGRLGAVAAWVAVWGFAPYFFTVPVLLHVFPDGRPLSARWKRVLQAVLGVAVLTTLARMFSAVEADLAPGVMNPLGLEGALWLRYVTGAGASALFVVGVPLAVLSMTQRMRRADEPERTQLLWLVLGGVALVVAGVVPLFGMNDGWGFAIGLVALPLAIGVGMLRHGLFDVRLTLNRTVVFGALTAAVVGCYVLVVYVADAAAPGSRWGVLLVAAAALVAAGLRDRVQDVVDRRLFGHRHNAYAVVAHVGRDVAVASQPLEALQRLVDGLREALRLPYAAFTGDDIALTSGEPTHGSRVVTVTALGESVGELHVGLRTPRERWTPQQQAAVEEVAARAGTLAYAAGLVTAIAVSRGRIVAAREEERRRLRGDLHDGVAPALAGAALQLDALARRLGPLDPGLAARAAGVRDGLRAGVGELRAVVHGLRPPVLDQLGLAGALRQLVAGHDTPACEARITTTEPLDAAIEVAAYAVAAEAFSNALRHSVASRVVVEAADDGSDLLVTVADNGVGMPQRPRPGVGLDSMRERAAEVGGRLDVLGTPGGGTTIRATLPRKVT